MIAYSLVWKGKGVAKRDVCLAKDRRFRSSIGVNVSEGRLKYGYSNKKIVV